MAMNRRNVLIGLGAIAAGGGAAFGSGAFSQVTADRTFSASIVADNNNAYLGLSPVNTNVASMNGNQLEVSFDSLNENAVTVFEGVFSVTNNGNDDVGVRIRAFDSTDTEVTDGSISLTSNTNDNDVTTFPGASGHDNNLASGGSFQVDVTLDDTVGDPTVVSYIQVEADASQYIV